MKTRKIIKAINHIVTILVFAVLLTMLFTVITMRASGGEPSLFGYQFKSVLSGSMEPDIKTGSIIAVKETKDDYHFSKDDVITFKTENDKTVTHRIDQVRDNGQSYITKGDANDAADLDPVLQENIIGLYSGFTIPYLGYVMNFVNSNEVAALLLILPGIYLVIYSIFQIGRALRAIDPPKKEVGSNTK
ncbi:S26 family signal peptidase [Lentibacillus kapialis]|uniref:Signal peptidase I n=1 Tax=Lentibacillus kapialis TaxID=340214 RepID=A0A917PYV7_9BACI|nr:signal peptidase I [Lentibacillus kapialis]GGK00255.1 S26 family signal peptidase [Lentibacillus kapialis]